MKFLSGRRGMLAAAAMALALSPALAGDLEDGMEAYDGGDYALAVAAWTRAAAAGQADAMTAIAGLYENGTGVTRDPALSRPSHFH